LDGCFEAVCRSGRIQITIIADSIGSVNGGEHLAKDDSEVPFPGTEIVIQRDKINLAAGDSSLVVDHVEEGGIQLGDHAIGICIANLDFGGDHARRIVCGRECKKEPFPAFSSLGILL
jgi:hypothetical protein